MTTWDKEKRIEEINEMLIQYGNLISMAESTGEVIVVDSRGKILQYIRTLIDLAEVHGALNEVRNSQ